MTVLGVEQFTGAVPAAAWLLMIQDAAAKVFDSCGTQLVTFEGTKPAFEHNPSVVTAVTFAQFVRVNPCD